MFSFCFESSPTSNCENEYEMKTYSSVSSYLTFSSPLLQLDTKTRGAHEFRLIHRTHLAQIPCNEPRIILLVGDSVVIVLGEKTKTSGSESPIWLAGASKWLLSSLLFQPLPNGRPIL